jgi:hypothetical protein
MKQVLSRKARHPKRKKTMLTTRPIGDPANRAEADIEPLGLPRRRPITVTEWTALIRRTALALTGMRSGRVAGRVCTRTREADRTLRRWP